MERRRANGPLPAKARTNGGRLTRASLQLVPLPFGGALAPVKRVAVSKHAPSVYLASLSGSSRHAQRIALDWIAAFASDEKADFYTLPWNALRHEHSAAIRAKLSDVYAPATAKRMLAALRGTLKAAWRLGQIPTEEYLRAVDVPLIRGHSLPRGRALSGSEMRLLFETCALDAGATGPRDAALLALLFGAGLRRFEAVALEVADFDPATGALSIRRGKGNQGRVCYLGAGGRDCLNYWLDFRGRKAGALLQPITRGGRILRRSMNPQTVMDICRRRAASSAIRPFTPHDCRRTFISNLLDEGHDMATVQKLAGHASPATTAKYDRRGEGAKRRAAESLFIPFFRPEANLRE